MSPDEHRALSARGGRNVEAGQRAFARNRDLAMTAGRKGGARGYESRDDPRPEPETPFRIAGKRVLVAEDDYLIAKDVAATLTEAGATIVGPAATVEAAVQLLETEKVDGAVLDINLEDEHVYRLADELTARKVPYIFITGYSRATIPLRYASVPLFEKPLVLRQIAGRLVL
ncbi:response regulator [Plastoroseomonas hellenica]|nr:response regulator [Plastoroseomonas hellenica]